MPTHRTVPLSWSRRLKWRLRHDYYLSTCVKRLEHFVSPIYHRDPIIVYQMGKVGSEALEVSLREADPGRLVLRVHAMIEKNIRRGPHNAQMSAKRYFYRSKTDFVGLHLGRQIRRDLHKHQWKVLTMVRDPVAQNVSSFFQILDLLLPDYQRRLDADDISTNELMDLFIRQYRPDSIFIRWFEQELGPMLDVDVYAHPFPFHSGFARIVEPHVDLLILRLEDFDRVAENAVGDFLGLQKFHRVRKNEGRTKAYAELYRRFRREAVFPVSYVDAVYGSRYARHFYSEGEIARFRASVKTAA